MKHTLVLLAALLLARSAAGADEINQHDILPIVLRHCTACHGPRQKEGGLDLRTRAAMLRGGKSGPAIVPGKPDESRLIVKIRAGEMPPPKRLVEASVKPVAAADLDKLARWIAAGAPEGQVEPDGAADKLVSDLDREFWSFRAPRCKPVPKTAGTSPAARHPVDAFILEKLNTKGLTLSPEADRLALLRRASFDLTGSPPEPGEVIAFLNDRSPEAYERLIDRLLASPHYGERWGRLWLDLAGYAD